MMAYLLSHTTGLDCSFRFVVSLKVLEPGLIKGMVFSELSAAAAAVSVPKAQGL